MYHMFLAPFTLPFMANALLELVVLGGLTSVVSVFVLIRRLAFVADTVTHTVFPGVVLGYLLGAENGIVVGALVAAVVTAIALTLFTARAASHARGGVGEDATLAILLTAMFSIGVVIVSRQHSYTSDLTGFLFGRILTVSSGQISQTVIIAVVALAIVGALRKELTLRAFDATGTRALGYQTAALDLALNIVVALTVVAAVRAVGTILVLALLVIPAAIGRVLSDRLCLIAVTSVLATLIASYLGLVISFSASVDHGVELACAPTIVLLLVAGYAAAFLILPLRRSRNGASA